MTRLTNDLRSQLTSMVIRDRYEEELVSIYDEFEAIAAEAFQKCMTKSEKEIMESLPRKWLTENNSLQVQINGGVTRLNFNGECFHFGADRRVVFKEVSRDPVKVKMPLFVANGVAKAFDVSSKISKRYEAAERWRDDYMERARKTWGEVKSVLASYNTIEKLIEGWPEIEPYAKSLNLAVPMSTVPAEKIENLNERLGLPKAA